MECNSMKETAEPIEQWVTAVGAEAWRKKEEWNRARRRQPEIWDLFAVDILAAQDWWRKSKELG